MFSVHAGADAAATDALQEYVATAKAVRDARFVVKLTMCMDRTGALILNNYVFMYYMYIYVYIYTWQRFI